MRGSGRAREPVAHTLARLAALRERHGQRWRLQPARPGSTIADVRPLLLLLGLPTLGLAFGISIVTTYGPVVLLKVAHSPTKVGVLIGGEGAFALVLPLLVGALSDRLRPTSLGRRLPFVLAGTPLVAGALVVLPFAGTYQLAGVAILLFFVGYYLYYPPYRALYADLLPQVLFARAQAGQAVARGAGLGAALLAGGLLLGLWTPLPFIVAACVVLFTVLALLPVVGLQRSTTDSTLPYEGASVRALLFRDRQMRAFALANALWEFSFAGLKSFIVLYVVKGLSHSPAVASAVIAVVAVAYVVGAPLAGRLADRYGLVPVIRWSSVIFGAGLCYGVLPRSIEPMLAALPIVALAGAVVLTLPQALAFTVAPPGGQGAASGLVDFSRGVGVVLGPVAVGAAVGAARDAFAATHGYAVMWPVIGIPVLVSLLLLPVFERHRGVPGDDLTPAAAGTRG